MLASIQILAYLNGALKCLFSKRSRTQLAPRESTRAWKRSFGHKFEKSVALFPSHLSSLFLSLYMYVSMHPKPLPINSERATGHEIRQHIG